MLSVSVYDTPHGSMALIVDEELVGRSFFDQEKGLALFMPEMLYSGKLMSEDEAARVMKSSHILVLAGKRAVSLAIRLGLAHPDSVVEIHGVPHVHVYKILFSE